MQINESFAIADELTDDKRLVVSIGQGDDVITTLLSYSEMQSVVAHLITVYQCNSYVQVQLPSALFDHTVKALTLTIASNT